MMRRVSVACALAVAALLMCGAGGSNPAGAEQYKGGDAQAAAYYRGRRGAIAVGPRGGVAVRSGYYGGRGYHGGRGGYYRGGGVVRTGYYGCLLYTSPSPRDS